MVEKYVRCVYNGSKSSFVIGIYSPDAARSGHRGLFPKVGLRGNVDKVDKNKGICQFCQRFKPNS